MMKLFLLSLVASAAAFSPSPSLRSIAQQQQQRALLQTNNVVLSSIQRNQKYRPLQMAGDKEVEEKQDETKKGFEAIKSAGRAGAISLFLWEAAFWIIAVPIVSIGYKQTTGHFPDFTDKSDLAILGAEVVAFANVARFALPLRIGLAITTIPWVQENVVDRFWPETEKTE
ncbi:hypothetical protein ACHAWO_003471 [Cyclotella atomus]|uniref:DUF1279 domain-containing protein n=1 Tax=Cyclotella atomus TaxID=382360 RepID=A0ABD3NX01_9STRA